MTPEKKTLLNIICIALLGFLCLVAAAQLPYIYSAPIINSFPEKTATGVKTVVSRSMPAEMTLPRPDDETLIFYDAHDPDLESSEYSSQLYVDRDSSYRVLSYKIRLTPENILADRTEENKWNVCMPTYEVFTPDLSIPLTQYTYQNAIEGLEEAICSYVGETNDQVMLQVNLLYTELSDLAPTYITIKASSPGTDEISLSCTVHNYTPDASIDYKTKQWIVRPPAKETSNG